jgi:methyl-accepting chemotaxis protein
MSIFFYRDVQDEQDCPEYSVLPCQFSAEIQYDKAAPENFAALPPYVDPISGKKLILKTIKNNILIYFCITGASIITTLGIFISLMLDDSLSRQSEILSDELNALIRENLAGQHNIFRSRMNRIGEAVERISQNIAKDHRVPGCIEKYLLTRMNSILESFKDRIDFALIFDPEGRHIASYPSDTGADVDIQWLEQYFRSWELGKEARKILENDSTDKEYHLVSVTKHDADFTKALRLTDRNFTGPGLISIASASVIRDDFGYPVAVGIAGRILNDYADPLNEFYDATGLDCAVYFENIPIAHAGFRFHKEKKPLTPAELGIGKEILQKIYDAKSPEAVSLKIAGRSYVAVCSPLSTSEGDNIGAVCVGMPEGKFMKISEKILSQGAVSKKDIQHRILLIGCVSVIVFIAVSLLIAVRIESPIRKIIRGLSDAAMTVISASAQVMTTSEHLAAGTSEQASSAEESLASLDEMAVASRETSELTRGSGQLMNDNIKKSVKTVMSLVELTEKIALIEKDSDQISDIIKIIDSIAFQTNLLALNAAVEAARAGAAGSGFAVVAGEVRNLASDVATSAENIQNLLDATIKRITESASAVKIMNRDFEGIVRSATVMGDKTTAITEASKELAKNMELIRNGISEMGKITYNNAANAEEFAAASEELNAQAEHLKYYVKQLEAMAGEADR